LGVAPGRESGFPRMLRACSQRKSVEGGESKRLAVVIFCQSHFFSLVTHTRGSRWSPKEFYILGVAPGRESGFPRMLRACSQRKSVEGGESKRLAVVIFCQSHFFSLVTHTRGSRWSPKEFYILGVAPGSESGFPRMLRACSQRKSVEGSESKRLAVVIFCQSHFFSPVTHTRGTRCSLIHLTDSTRALSFEDIFSNICNKSFEY